MKIAIIGYSGSGKSTLAGKLGRHLDIPVLHLDTVHHLPGWGVRELDSEKSMVDSFLNQHASWVIDGNYSKLSYERRMKEADWIILLLFSRASSLLRVIKRYRRYKGKSRPDMAEGCQEKLDFTFLRWVLWDGRSKAAKARFQQVMSQFQGKVVLLKTQKQIDAFEREWGLLPNRK